MLTVHLIRHGETNWNKEKRVQGRSESTLTPKGKAQAAKLGMALQKHRIARVYCSSSVRTRETADILFADTTVETEYRDDLREIHLGSWEGSLQTEIQARDPDRFAHFWTQPELFNLSGAESFQDVQTRGVNAFRQILQTQEAEEIAIVSHGVIIKSILCHLEGRSLEKLWEPPVMHNCAHSIVEIHPGATPGGTIAHIRQYADIVQ